MRTTIIALTVLLALLSCGLAIFANSKSSRMQEALEKERYHRMVTEEKLQQANAQINSLNEIISRKDKKLTSNDLQIKQLTEGIDDLKSRLDKAAKIKSNLDQQIAELQKISVQ